MTTTFITLDVWQSSDIRVKVNQGEVNSRFLQVCVAARDESRRGARAGNVALRFCSNN